MTRRTIMRLASKIVVWMAVAAIVSPAFAGSLEPPGPPAPTFRPVDETRRCTPLSVSPGDTIISQSGVYCLEPTSGFAELSIQASGVVIDLMGQVVTVGRIGTSGSGLQGIEVRNGTLASSDSVPIDLGEVVGGRVIDVFVDTAEAAGIVTGDHGLVEGCVVRNVVETEGITMGDYAVVRDTVVVGTGGSGIVVGAASTIEDCTVAAVSFGPAVRTGPSSTVSGCSIRTAGGDGISAPDSLVTGSTVTLCDGAGIVAGRSFGNYCNGNGSGDPCP